MENFNLSFPIEMIKKEQRIISGIATADNIDKSGDIVEFEASLEAFKNWGGNIREMHAPIAVGKAVNYEAVIVKDEDGNEYNAIRVDAYISKGAQDTWEKILDGTLKAFSIGGKIMEKSESTTKMFRGKPVNIIKKYSLGELSVVDNPANAIATVDIVKRDASGDLNYVLEDIIDKASPLKDPKGGLTAAGRRHFKETEGANLKPGVKGPANTPEKMRRKGSFLTRFFTNPSGPMKDEKGRPTRLALSAAAWGEPVPQNAQDAAELAAKGRRLLERYQNTKEKSMKKEGEVTVGSMGAGIKNPTQGSYQGPIPGSRKKKKENSMKNKLKKNSPLTDSLNNLLSNTAVLYFSSHRAHWNVEGTDFREYHDLFGEIYEDTYDSIDPIAESIRKLGDFPIALGDAEDMSSYEDDSATTDARELAADIYEKNKMYLALVKEAFNVATDSNEQGIANLLAGRIEMHEKWDWQLRASLGISTGTPSEDPEDSEDSEDSSTPGSLADMLTQMLEMSNKSEDGSDLIKMQEDKLQNDIKYDKVFNMNEQEYKKLSLLKRVVNWLVPDVEENASTENDVEVTKNTQEEIMDIEILKDALSAVVDEKLATFATSIKEEIEATVQVKLDDITKGFEVQATELKDKLEEAEEQVKVLATAGAIKKSVDPEDDEDGEELVKSAPTSIWNNVYLPQGLINSLGYKS
jgi:DNA-binding ferritin-like protein